MKRLIVLMLMLMVLTAFTFAGEVSGETRVDVERDMVTELNVYAIDAGAVYETGFLKIGADVFADTDDDLDIGIPIIFTGGGLILKVEPGADNLRVETIYVFDGDITYTLGMFEFAYGFGYGTDEVLDMSAKFTVTTPGVIIDVEWSDADDVKEDIFGIVEAGVTVKY